MACVLLSIWTGNAYCISACGSVFILKLGLQLHHDHCILQHRARHSALKPPTRHLVHTRAGRSPGQHCRAMYARTASVTRDMPCTAACMSTQQLQPAPPEASRPSFNMTATCSPRPQTSPEPCNPSDHDSAAAAPVCALRDCSC